MHSWYSPLKNTLKFRYFKPYKYLRNSCHLIWILMMLCTYSNCYHDVPITSWNALFIFERVVSNDSRNSIYNTGGHHTKEPVFLKRTQLMNVSNKILIACIVVKKRKQMKTEMNGTGLNLQILIAVWIVILKHKVNKI